VTDSIEPDVNMTRRTPWRVAGRWLADLVIPPVCVACHTPLSGHDALCATCWRTIAFIRQPLCDRLGIPMPFGGSGAPLISAAAAADPPLYNRARAVAVFDGDSVIRHLIHAMKYADRHEARRLLGRWMTDAGRDLLDDADVIIPVPLTRWRLMRRQFNQAAMLAQEIARASGVPTNPHALAKIKTTPPQVGLTREQRRLNVRGAFSVPQSRKAAVYGKRVLLIDDVITTGATAEACVRALQAAGATSVDVLAVGLVATPVQISV